MNEIARKYIVFFIINSLMYLAVDKFREIMGYTTSNEVIVALVVIALLSVVSLLTRGAYVAITGYNEKLPKSRIVSTLILVAVVAVLVDVIILITLTTQLAGLKTEVWDRLILAALCEIAPFVLSKKPVDKSQP